MAFTLLLLFVFTLGYTLIIFEHRLKIDKLIPALLMMVIAWTLIMLGNSSVNQWFAENPLTGKVELVRLGFFDSNARIELFNSTLLHHLGKTAEILIFLMGAMTIVELIDHFDGFSSVKNIIKTKKKIKLLWVISFLAFSLSAVIDNLTATIVLITIIRKIVAEQTERIWFSGFIVIAANAGGVWTPIGDVTTTMLWMAEKVSSWHLVKNLIIPSLLNIFVPLLIASFMSIFKGNISGSAENDTLQKGSNGTLILGIGMIIFVPLFKTLTHTPPYLGMMLSLSIMAIFAEYKSKRALSLTSISENQKTEFSPTLKAVSRIEIPSILFFLGILMTVAALESTGLIHDFGKAVNQSMSSFQFVTLIGFASAIFDNVPLVAASMGMFNQQIDADVWHLLAYAAGTGGSMLIIGSAAGVVAMGMEKISFSWYLKNLTFRAFLGYIAGIIAFWLLN
ncbi:MAG: sodium:proton antiporter NhaD [Flavobacteriia bacterium]